MRRHNTKTRRGVNWLKYPTDIKHVYLRLHCDNHGAFVHFDFQFKDSSVREIVWEQMQELKVVMEKEMGSQGIWNRDLTAPEGFVFDRISWENRTLNYYHREEWNSIYAFLKERLLAFDRFYQEFKDVLILLVE
jgi:hypothetical protein